MAVPSRLIANGLITFAVAAPVLALTSGVASATPGGYCGVYGSGVTPTQEFTKKPPGCHDVNITYTQAGFGGGFGHYGGYYLSGSSWRLASRGYQYLADGGHNPNTDYRAVPITALNTGVKFYIASNDTIYSTVHINY